VKKNKIRAAGSRALNIIVVLVSFGLGRTYPIPVCIFAAMYFAVILGIAINKRSTIQSHGGDTTAVRGEIKGYVVWMVVIAAILGYQIWSVGGFKPSINSSSQSPQDLASQGAREAKSSTTLPYQLDSVTTLNDITSEGNIIQYHYTIHDADTSNLSNDSLEASIKPNVCANTSTKQLLADGVNMQYLYTVKETNAQYSFTIAHDNC